MKIRKRRSDRSGRAPLSSPGRPSVAGRDERRRFWAAIAVGLESEDAALEAGVPPVVGAGISCSRSGRKSRFFARGATQCGKSLAGSGGNSVDDLTGVAAQCRHSKRGLEYRATTARWHAERAARRQSRGSLRSTRHCEPMLLCPAQPCPGKAVDMDGGRIGRGQTPGARSRSPAGSRSTSRTMTPCASAMKPSIKPFEDEARCGAS